MGVKNASGGGVTDRLAPHVGADGKIEVAPTEGDVPNATTSFHVAAQAKMKMNTVFTVLAGKGIPAGMDGSGAGVQPDGARSQFGLSELLVYRAALDKGAKTVPRGAFEKMVDALETQLRVATKAPRLLTVGKALVDATVTLESNLRSITRWRPPSQGQTWRARLLGRAARK